MVSLANGQAIIILSVWTCGDSASCPIYGRPPSRVHSRYRRKLANLPWSGIPAQIVLRSRRFFCGTPDCPHCTSTERLPGVAVPPMRRTQRLRDFLLHVACALGGEPGARLLHRLGIMACGNAMRALPMCQETSGRAHSAHPECQRLCLLPRAYLWEHLVHCMAGRSCRCPSNQPGSHQ